MFVFYQYPRECDVNNVITSDRMIKP